MNDAIHKIDYSLTGVESKNAKKKGLVDAQWYLPPVSKKEMKKLLERRDIPAILDTLLWFGLIFFSGFCVYFLWGTYLVVFPILIYSVLYYSTADSRWHESGHGTAFKTDWMNNFLYFISSFMLYRLPISWRWSHARHHSDTIIVGRDPEITAPRPPDIKGMILKMIGIKLTFKETKKWINHLRGKVGAEEAEYVPKDEYHKMLLPAWIWVFIYSTFIGLAIFYQTTLPLFYVIFPKFFGSYLKMIYALTQHAGLAENVLDHRKNCRTIYMNRVNRFLYWNMNYHLEHHMFPLVPYYNLPKLHELVKKYCPKPYGSIYEAYKEIIPAIIKQTKDPTYFVEREIPIIKEDSEMQGGIKRSETNLIHGWLSVCKFEDIEPEDVIRLDFEERTFAIYKTKEQVIYATDGMCTHGKTHLADGLVMGDLVECPKHNGRFNFKDGTVKRHPVCVGLNTYKTKVVDGVIMLNPNSGIKVKESKKSKTYEVISNSNLATFIKELKIKPVEGENIEFTPGDYMQLEIPKYQLSFNEIEIEDNFKKVWKNKGLLKLSSENESKITRNYSIATNPRVEDHLKFNVRLALPLNGSNNPPGLGSSYLFNLKKGDTIELFGPFGDFHLKQTQKEIIFIGGGAGMAPFRSQISHLFDTMKTTRKVSYWYGARSKKEIFYKDYFNMLDDKNKNFNFNIALSEPLPEDQWKGYIGYIHEVVNENYLNTIADLSKIEFYLCGPPLMIKACRDMLSDIGVKNKQILFDAF